MLGWIVAAIIALMGLFFMLQGDAKQLADPDNSIYIGIGAVFLAVYALWLIGAYRDRLGQALGYLLAWSLIGFALIAGYSYREEFSAVANRIVGELVPAGEIVATETSPSGRSAVRFRRRGDGHFVARAEVNGASIRMMVDTGASSVVLQTRDARRAGIDIDGLSYTVAVSTANGMAYAAPVRLGSIAVGPIVMRNVEALVAKPGSLNESLLGMSFLGRLRSYEFSGAYLTLKG